MKLIDGNKWGLYPGAVLPDDQFVHSSVEAVESPYRTSGSVKSSRPRQIVSAGFSAAASGTSRSDALAACRGGK